MSDVRVNADGTSVDATAEAVQSAAKVAGVDVYAFRARVLPAILAAAPLLAIGVVALPFLEGAQKLWSVTSLAVPAFATLLSRRAGNRVQDDLYRRWGGAPTTQRLRFSSSASPEEIHRRHQRIRAILGDDLTLPDEASEEADSYGSDRRYADAVRRLRPKVRNNPSLELLNLENRNYGFARNLLGLKPLGLACAWLGLAGATVMAAVATWVLQDPPAALVALLPAAVSALALAGWRMVDADYVRPCADAYANAFVEALDMLPDRPPA
jgi:hypothetical protein